MLATRSLALPETAAGGHVVISPPYHVKQRRGGYRGVCKDVRVCVCAVSYTHLTLPTRRTV